MLFLKLPNDVTSHLYLNLCTGSKLINELITSYSLLHTYKVLTTTQPSYLHNLISLQPPRCTRTFSVVTLACPPASSSLKITNCSFQHTSPHLWKKLPVSPHQPCFNQSSSPLSSSVSPLSSSITPSPSHSKLERIFQKSFPPLTPLLYLLTGLTSRISGCFCFHLLNGFLFSSHVVYFLVYGVVQ